MSCNISKTIAKFYKKFRNALSADIKKISKQFLRITEKIYQNYWKGLGRELDKKKLDSVRIKNCADQTHGPCVIFILFLI